MGPKGLAPAALSQASVPAPPLVLPDSVQVALSEGPALPPPLFGLSVLSPSSKSADVG